MNVGPPLGADSRFGISWLTDECRRLFEFGRRLEHPAGGAAWLDDEGRPDNDRPVFTWITARMAHVYCLAQLLGDPDGAALADISLAGLSGPLRDSEHGGWLPQIAGGQPVPDIKGCYEHAFVVLAASSATVAGRPAGAALLADALAVWNDKFWDPAEAMYVDQWDRSWSVLSPYRGANANMHAVEALLAASDATGDLQWRHRALGMAERIVDIARAHQWRIPEHYDPGWRPQLELHRERPDDQFQPFGATVGHGLEWSRLLLHLHSAVATAAGGAAPRWLVDGAQQLFDRAVVDGWDVDGAAGFVYTTDWTGRPVVRQRLHWVVTEAIAAAAALYRLTGESRYRGRYTAWWGYADRYLIDRQQGSWHAELDPSNHPASTVWQGKPDLYHAVQATLIPRLPLAPGMALALREGLLESRFD